MMIMNSCWQRMTECFFFKDRKYPIIIDEVQYAKELMRQIKFIADSNPKKGQIILTGSQTYELLSESAESLAGRVSILELPGLSCREIYGAIFETFAVSEIIKSFLNNGQGIEHIYFYRDKDKHEIDLLIEDGVMLYPIEIKKGATINKDWVKNFSVLQKISDRNIGAGAVICQIDRPGIITENVTAYPLEYI